MSTTPSSPPSSSEKTSSPLFYLGLPLSAILLASLRKPLYSSSSSSSNKATGSPIYQFRQGGGTTASCQVTRAVHTMSLYHQTSFMDTARKYFYSPKHFPKILGGIMLASGIAGYYTMGYLHEQKIQKTKRIYIDAYHNSSSSSSNNNNNAQSQGDSSSLVSLARKMTNRITDTAESRLQKQYTKYW